jgi:hypothetical protein
VSCRRRVRRYILFLLAMISRCEIRVKRGKGTRDGLYIFANISLARRHTDSKIALVLVAWSTALGAQWDTGTPWSVGFGCILL